jgi:uncharacterized protein
LKISERCNLACSYCYFFFGGDLNFQKHSPLITEESIDNIVNFLATGAIENAISNIEIILHGGEPLLVKKSVFNKMCAHFYDKLGGLNIKISVQTNAMLVDSEWIDIFRQHKVDVGINLDGPKEYHDKFRLDKKGHGSYDRTVLKIKQIQDSSTDENRINLGCLSVINLDFDPEIIYRHIVHDLGFNSLDLLLPDFNHDTFNQNPLDYGLFLIKLFDVWFEDNNPNIMLRFCFSVVRLLMGKDTLLGDFSKNIDNNCVITISSDGDLFVDDSLRSTSFDFDCDGKSVSNMSLQDFCNSESMKKTKLATRSLPDLCEMCCWKNICNGGQLVHRYSKNKEFNNPSVYCEGLKLFYKHVSIILMQHGIKQQEIEKNLLKDIYANA